MRKFVISDLHFCHENIIRYCNRPFADADEMNRELIRRWNETVGHNDHVWFLGDFAFGKRENRLIYGQQLHGRKTIILGNHDRRETGMFYDAGFADVIEGPYILDEFVLTHEPLCDMDEKVRAEYGYYINLYGHVHDDPDYETIVPGKSACLCCERWDYTPVDLALIRELVGKRR